MQQSNTSPTASKKRKFTVRGIHRDLGYFYVGLIIAFSISGILLNHRGQFNASEYAYDVQPVTAQLPADAEMINDSLVKALCLGWGLDAKEPRWRVREGLLRVRVENTLVEVDMKTGKGEKESMRKVPLIAQTLQLHTDTSNWWIYYSDVFGAAMLTMAITGMFIQKGSSSFRKRGWILALVGILFPLVFLFLIA
jgi:uncharacterized protein